jgi:hypothetical protein
MPVEHPVTGRRSDKEMFAITKILSGTLAATVISTALVSGGSAFAAVSDGSHDKVDHAALDAFRTTLNDLIKDDKLTASQRDAIMDAFDHC